MINLYRYTKLINKSLLLNCRYISINKSDLVESSRNIQELVKSTDDISSTSKWLYSLINNIHEEYPAKQIAVSTKDIYQKTSSKFNSIYLQLENDRKKQTGHFQENNLKELIVLLRYVRYLQIAFIYRFITYDINNALKESVHSIINITKNQKNIHQSSLTLTCELTFFVHFLCCHCSLSHVRSLLSSTFIVNHSLNNLFSILTTDTSILLVNQLCLSLHSILEIPALTEINSWPHALLKYLHDEKSCSLSIIKYLIFIQHSCTDQNTSEINSLLNKYLTETGIYQENINIICQLLILISSFNYSHELFQRDIIKKIENFLNKSTELGDIKLCSRLIYYLCLNDPTNRFGSRAIILQLSKKLNDNLDKEMKFPQWIVQAQYGMMLSNVYNYQLLFSTLQQKYFPLLFRDLGIYTRSVQRQLFDIHCVLSVDRASLKTRLLNSEMLSFTSKISDEYRLSNRPKQKLYNRFLTELKESFDSIYGNDTCRIIDTNINYPYILFDFLELNLPDTDELRMIGINVKQRIAVLPILNSMLIRQQRSDGSLLRVPSAQTTMRYRLIQKNNYQVVLIFYGEYLRAIRDNTIKTLFETSLALKSIPHQLEDDHSLHL